MKIHILGICGTFMGGLAQLCKESGWDVSGSDQQVYSPMSDQLDRAGIFLYEGFDPEVLTEDLDIVVIGNALSRMNPVVEEVLDRKIKFVSGPELLGQLTKSMTVFAVSGTHGKTTTCSLLAHILDWAGLNPGFLIGGVPLDFGITARLGGGQYFVVEADEYDTAFFDKRSKFVHYHPDIFGINNLEFDHADIFDSLTAIETQFHQAIRCIPRIGTVVARRDIDAIDRVLKRGLWSNLMEVGQGTSFHFTHKGHSIHAHPHGLKREWSMRGAHNARNAELAVAMASTVGVSVSDAFDALATFSGVTRRLNKLYQCDSLVVWDDFAHHPTAIEHTIKAVRDEAPNELLHAVIELRSNTMRAGVHGVALLEAVKGADQVTWVVEDISAWNISALVEAKRPMKFVYDASALIPELVDLEGQIVFMSNGSFSGIQRALVKQLSGN